MGRPPRDVLKIALGPICSLDLVRLPGERQYLVVFAERGSIQRRTIARLEVEQAAAVARFLGGAFSSRTTLSDIAGPVAEEVTEVRRAPEPEDGER